MSKKIIDHQNVFDYSKKNKRTDDKNSKSTFVNAKNAYNTDKKSSNDEKNFENVLGENIPYKNKKEELLYCGVHTCQAVFAQRKDDIIKVYLLKELIKEFSNLLKFCSTKKIAYRIVENKDLEKLTDSTHHEGIAVLTKSVRPKSFTQLPVNAPILWLDGVVNPHNIGTVMRIMAHFGWQSLLVSGTKISISAAMARMSEGGCEFVKLYEAPSANVIALWAKKNGYKIIGTSSHCNKSVYEYHMHKKTLFVVGQEADGISNEVMRLLDESLIIPGTGNVESLNVSVATGIFLNEYSRKFGIK